MESDPHILILASGRERRMHSELPKPLHPVLFRPMIHYVLDLASALPHQSLSMIVGRGEPDIREQCRAWKDLEFFTREAPPGESHRPRGSFETLLRTRRGPMLVLSGDLVLLGRASLKRMLDKHLREGASCTVGMTTLASPNGHRRIVRRSDGRIIDILHEAECSGAQKAINEVDVGIYCLRTEDYTAALAPLGDRDSQGDPLFPEIVRRLASEDRKVLPFSFGDPQEVMGIEDRYTLWRAEAVLQERVNKELMHRGVTLHDPRTTWIDPRCKIEEDVSIEAGSVLVNSVVKKGALIESHCRIVDSLIGARSRVLQGSYIERSLIGGGCSIGPYARLKPSSLVKAGERIGSFVELKPSAVGAVLRVHAPNGGGGPREGCKP